jgi:two-component system cell cycle response regulator CpdR
MARIMLTTTDNVLRRYLAEKLKRAGHFVTRVDDYDVALTLLCETYHDVLLAGVDNDEARGLAFAHEARLIDPEMRVIFITGFALVPLIAGDGEIDEGVGFGDQLGEPQHLSQLVDAISEHLAA